MTDGDVRQTRLQFGERLFGIVVHAGAPPAATTFVTQPDDPLQLGFIVHAAGHAIAPHAHHPIARALTGTPEVLRVQQGRCHLDLFDDADGTALGTVELAAGDVVILLGGGHGFRMIEDTVFLEVKQGPYPGPDEKRFL